MIRILLKEGSGIKPEAVHLDHPHRNLANLGIRQLNDLAGLDCVGHRTPPLCRST
jgi:hypothetical protein